MTRSSNGETADVSDPQSHILVEGAGAGSENDAGVNGNRLMDVIEGEPPPSPQRKKRAAAKTVSLRKSNATATTAKEVIELDSDDGDEDFNSGEQHVIGSEHEDEGFNEAVNDFVQNEFLSPDNRKNQFVVSDDSNNIALEAELTAPEVTPDEIGDLSTTHPGSQSVNSLLNTPLASPSKSKGPPPSKRYNSNGEETTVWKDHYFAPGLLVYCPWPGKNPIHEPWYWGVVRRKFKMKANKLNLMHYSVKFVDGDFLPAIRSTHLLSHDEYCKFANEGRLIRDDPPENWKDRLAAVLEDEAEFDGNFTSTELYQNRCQECTQCKKRECGQCDACFLRSVENSPEGMNLCCLQKMCETIDDDKKAQTCAGLPEDWRFLFTAGDEKSKDMGLVLIAPDGQRFKGIELAQQAFPRSKFDEKSIRTSLGLYPLTEFSSSFGDDQSLGDDDNDSTLTLIELWRNRCHDCHNCNREDCKRCAACLQNERGKSKACCLRRFCCAIPSDKKAQQAPYFPRGWKYYFDPLENRRFPHYDGLVILAPAGNRRYQNVGSAINHNKKALDLDPHPNTFYEYVGLQEKDHIAPINSSKPVISKTSSVKREDIEEPISRSDLKEHVASANLEELAKVRCNNCMNCTRRPCKNCDSCHRNLEGNANECCVRRICCRIPEEKKALQAPYFPKGWLFFFDAEKNTKLPDRDGLVLLAPNGRRYQSVENAMNHNPISILKRSPDARTFYLTVGLPSRYDDIPIGGMKRRNSTGSASDSRNSKRPRSELPSSSESHATPTHLNINFAPGEFENGEMCTPKQLFQMKCGVCEMCQKEDCKVCATCRRNSSHTCREKEVCLRKMCAKISPGKKRQPIDGFPTGWYVYFESPTEDDVGMRIVTPWGLVYSTLEVLRRYEQLDNILGQRERFSKQVGPLPLDNDENLLLGMGFSREWINSHGQRLHISGVITAVQTDAVKGETEFKVVWDEHSRDLVNGLFNVCKFLQVPKTECFQESNALGGHYLDNTKRGREKDSQSIRRMCLHPPYHESWLVPDLSHESSDLDDKGNVVPVLTMVFRGFQLVFRAKQSTIPNAGYGVFVTAKSMRGESCFELEPGQLLDIGVYAPFTPDMRKEEHIFLLKNFLLKMEPEEYCFNTHVDSNDTIYDVIDDATGELHAEARRHIPPYVNEISAGGQQTVHAKHDPQGALHYLLGHGHGCGTFQLPADGVTETEIFMDYGVEYESVRVRKGYSRLPPEEAAAMLKNLEENEENEHLAEIRSFSINDMKSFLKWLISVFEPTQRVIPSQDFKLRSLLVAILMKMRVRAIENEFADLPEGESDHHFGGWSDVDTRESVKKDIDKIVSLLFEGYNDDEGAQKALIGGKFAVLLGNDLCNSDLSPQEFRALVEAL